MDAIDWRFAGSYRNLSQKKNAEPLQESITFQCKHRFFEVKRIEQPLVFVGWI